MLLISMDFYDQRREMRSFLINKNLSLYYLLRKRIGKRLALVVVNTIEKSILIFGREILPSVNKNEVPTEQLKSGLGDSYKENQGVR